MKDCVECMVSENGMCDFHVWNEVPMNYWPRFTFHMYLSELKYTDETETAVERVYFDEYLTVASYSQEGAVAAVRKINEFRHTKLEKLFLVKNAS